MKNIAELALDQVVVGYMSADEDWLERHSSTSYSYWLGSLETLIGAGTNPDGSATLRAQTLLHHDVQGQAAAKQVCKVLNELSPSWAFVYEPGSNLLKAVASVCILGREKNEPPLGIAESDKLGFVIGAN